MSGGAGWFLAALLIACGPNGGGDNTGPTDDTGDTGPTDVTVTPEGGGSVTSADGRFTLDVPPNAVSEAVTITITATTAPDDAFPAGVAYDLQPDGLEFLVPATATLRVAPSDMAAADPLPEYPGSAGTDLFFPVVLVLGEGAAAEEVESTTDATGDPIVVTAPVAHFTPVSWRARGEGVVVRTDMDKRVEWVPHRLGTRLEIDVHGTPFVVTGIDFGATGDATVVQQPAPGTDPIGPPGDAWNVDLQCPDHETSGRFTFTVTGHPNVAGKPDAPLVVGQDYECRFEPLRRGSSTYGLGDAPTFMRLLLGVDVTAGDIVALEQEQTARSTVSSVQGTQPAARESSTNWATTLTPASGKLLSTGLAQDGLGNVAVVGTDYEPDYHLALTVLEPDGGLAWQRGFSRSGKYYFADGVIPGAVGGWLAIAAIDSQVAVLAIDPAGHVVSETRYGSGTPDLIAFAVAPREAGGGYLAGQLGSTAWAMALDADGTVLWQKTLSLTGWSLAAYSIAADATGVIVTGNRANQSGPGSGNFVLHLGTAGQVDWALKLDGFSVGRVAPVDGGSIVAGDGDFGGGQDDIALVRLDTTPAVLWVKTYEAATGNDETFGDIVPFADGVAVAGGSHAGADPTGGLLLPLDADGKAPGCATSGVGLTQSNSIVTVGALDITATDAALPAAAADGLPDETSDVLTASVPTVTEDDICP